MTYFEDAGKSYLIWSYRKDIGTPRDSGSMLLIAETTKERPWLLRTDPVLLSRPLYGYENCRGTINNEGPYVYKKNGRIHVNYSGGDARGYLYIINLLSADSGADLLDPKSFRKRTTPLCNFKTWTGVYGPGHNSYFTDDQGKDWILFHAVDTMAGKRIAVGAFAYPENLE
ncbi:MAG: family 43 glycosylhydrolase [Lachnospiraceae bacterium]|nr:family 43 glycosylhydrolase [Lachnospiraceae bacterium]